MISNYNTTRAAVTGSASGIGRALVSRLLDAGATVMAMDINAAALENLKQQYAECSGRLHTTVVDISSPEDVEASKNRCDDLMGGVDLLFNNAGVAYNAQPIWSTPNDQVEWNFSVNVYGVINGIRAYVPDMIARGHGHVVNTASIGGFQVSERVDIWHQGLYASTKYAVVALSEALEIELRGKNVGVSILAPGGVATGIASSDQSKPSRFGGPTQGSATVAMKEMLARDGVPPDFVAQVALRGVLENQLYIFTHPEFASRVAQRHRQIEDGFKQSESLIAQIMA
jgi:NAD(P)-dependent dehydrogenase (short-subunit alcohol dehydrogenase family)